MNEGEPQPGYSRWPAPAKINLFLHILGRRTDGYHELQTCFQFLDRCDWLDLRVREDGLIRRESGLAIAPEKDLVVRAARLLQARTATMLGVDIRVHKHIPAGAGLGGGSSDAATTLLALNELWRTGLDLPALQALGLNLGADVPVFVGGLAAFAEGVGERLTALPPEQRPPEHNYLILKPDCEVGTAAIFAAPELTRNSPPITIRGFLEMGGRNDCTATVCGRFPPVGSALNWLSQFGEARLTGTGACLFLAVESEAAGEAIRRRIPAPWSGFIARGLNESPMRARLQADRSSV
ncbi:MAG: 4-(cytidine 5'-diphospho)-2-C-methyl-D-erythritol kinase [Proteobacteria bacterium]|nr:4-(cytidine 5'-diphospho)-2-C-methyl-D-erythritol kinase [Pseudomonadota bacterium]